MTEVIDEPDEAKRHSDRYHEAAVVLLSNLLSLNNERNDLFSTSVILL